MEVIPAIDIRGGKCVRLYQGDYAQETIYSESPADVASRWVSMGASRLHVVDLDGAKQGVPVNLGVIQEIAVSAGVPIQLGGGIRSLEVARAAISASVDRVMIGTAAVENPGLIESLCYDLGADHVVVSVDARDGVVALKGWTESSEVTASDLIKQMMKMGVRRFLYTDITRDGTLTAPNFQAIEALLEQPGLRLLAAGGISRTEHLECLASLGVEGVVIGKALYTGDINLMQALEKLSQHETNTS
jgi:phosphoribosylformimino-5-aminoimidazole carboxamide ribotide isomerase